MELKTEATIEKAGIRTEKADYRGNGATILDLSFSLRLPKPEGIKSIEDWSADYRDGGVDLKRKYEAAQRAKAAKAEKKGKPKGKKDEPEEEFDPCVVCSAPILTEDENDNHVCPPCPTCGRAGDDRSDCECGGAIEDAALLKYLQPHYDAYAAKKREHNQKCMLASQHAAMFISLIGTPVNIALQPVQEGMLFMLGEGE